MYIRRLLLSLLFCCLLSGIWAQKHSIEKLDARINSSQYDELMPVITLDGETLFFTRGSSPDFQKTIWIDGADIADSLSNKAYFELLREIYSEIAGYTVSDPVKSSFNQDIWFAEGKNGQFSRLSHPPAPLNNALPNSICSITAEGDAYVVVNQFSKEGGMNKGFSTVRRLPDGTWTDPVPIDIDGYDIVSSAISLTMSSEGQVIIMSLPVKGKPNDTDLFISFKIGDNHYSKPQNMGIDINTAAREVTPHLSPDGKELYFASNRAVSLGGLDLFYATRLDDTWLKWSRPRAFVAPINTPADETEPYYNYTTGHLYFSSRRDGSSDIFRVKIGPDMPHQVLVKGKIINARTQQTVDARVVYGASNAPYYEHYGESVDGHFMMYVPQGQSLKIAGLKPGYISHEKTIYFDKYTYFSKPQEIILLLDSVAIGNAITLEPIFFKSGTADILPESEPALEHLADILRNYREIQILVGGHTDDSGTPAERQKLSETRAEAVKKALIAQNIAANRIDTKGFGSSQPLNTGSSETDRQQNRRVEIIIKKLAY